jgi:uncharacterized membrane protein YheB (UPF0754 family)
MNAWFLLIPLLTAFAGWFSVWILAKTLFRPVKAIKILGFKFQGILPARQAQIAEQMARLVKEELFSFEEVEKKIISPENIQAIMPAVEIHIDDFLRHKIGKAMPVISMFIGEKTTKELKTVFMKELEEIFPIVLKDYINNLKSQVDIEKLVAEKLSSLSIYKIESAFLKPLSAQLNIAGLIGALIGLCIGIMQFIIVSLTI